MEVQEDTQDLNSVVSDLSALEHDADEFDRLMIQNARDERRLNEALHGRVHAFRKARTHPRVGLTIDNLERNNARNNTSVGANTHVKFESPPSSNGSARSDPAIHAPPGWGRKSRLNRNWMRTITYEEEQQQQTPIPADGTMNGQIHPYQQYADDAHDANIPRRSVEDSPLSHKSSIHGTPRNDRSADWDLTFELNEASMIASTPYIPRNTALDDIRQREIESLRDQGVTTARLDRVQEGSPEQTHRPQSSSAKSTNTVHGTSSTEQETPGPTSPQQRLRTRTNSWQSIGKSKPVTGIGKENSPFALYKSAESIDTVEHDLRVHSETNLTKPIRHRRADSQDLLRRLARASNTPSPGRVVAPRPQTAPQNSSLEPMTANTPPVSSENKDQTVEGVPIPENMVNPVGQKAIEEQTKQHESKQRSENESIHELIPASSPKDDDVDVTPMPHPRSKLDPKTPVVTGAWVDTPGPRTARRSSSISRSPPRSSEKSKLQESKQEKGKSPKKANVTPFNKQALGDVPAEAVQPSLPSSALQALVQEARSNDRRQSADFGDSTINSLEELISPLPGSANGEIDEDTLQGLPLPTGTPRSEAERQRQQELLHLHRMNDRLRAARTSIRDASRGMKRVEDRVEHAEDGGTSGGKVQLAYRECPCVTNDGHQLSLRKWFKSLFWQQRIKTARQVSNSPWQFWGGFTALTIFGFFLFTWWVSEEIACGMYCQPKYAQSSPYPFAVKINAPQYPFVIPTLIFRKFIKDWWIPLSSFVSWICATMYKYVFGFEDAASAAREAVRGTATNRAWYVRSQAAQVTEESAWDLRMTDDQLLEH
ncbi:hypothetical protein BKA66DRAFT_420068 [Pyrenochaeta sp. MPI-SDFR-AT-0127]|nr:hypothetical protein BKA66DRAFT_420068 [Pyrenochaeta sp. MPI-SDFR-AT-0127]